jgi:hypothetical protein
MSMPQTESSQANGMPLVGQVVNWLELRHQAQRFNAIAVWVKGEFDKCKRQRWGNERQWYLNLAFYHGHHWVQWVKSTATASGIKLYVPPAPPWRVRLTINKCRPIIRKEIAKLTSQKPNWTVVPNSTEDQDIVAAQVAEQIFAAGYEEKDFQVILKHAVWWSSNCGTSYIKCYWDPGKICGYGPQKYMGDIEVEEVDTFHLYVPDLRQRDIEKQAYVIHAQTRPVEWCKAKWPDKGFETNVRASHEIMEEAFLRLTDQTTNFTEEVLLLEMWIKPNMLPKFPNGAYILVAGNQLVDIKEAYPYEHGMYPFAKIDHILSGRYYATSVLEDIVSVQREYNRSRSQIVENKNMTGRPQFMAPKGTMQASKVTSEPGQIHEYVPGLGPPTQLQPTGLPQYISDHMDRLERDFDDLSAQHEISRGEAPGSVVAATAINSLQEADDSQLSTTVDSVEAAIKKIGKLYLFYVIQFWDQPRLVKVTGVNQSFDAQVFQGSALMGNTDIRIESGSALATSKASKRAFIMDLMTNQLIPPEEGLKMLDIAGIEKIYENLLIDIKQAGRENLKMEAGFPVPVNIWDNHEIHILEHNKFRKSQQFEMLDPQLQAVFEEHVSMHQMAMVLGADQMALMGSPPVGALPPGQEGQSQPVDPNTQPMLPGMV